MAVSGRPCVAQRVCPRPRVSLLSGLSKISSRAVILPLPADPASLKRHFFVVQVHGFMDEHTFDLQRLIKCCIHELLPDGRAVPFCAYNTMGYREEVRAALGGV